MQTVPEGAHAASRFHACSVVQSTRQKLRIAQAVYLTTTLHHHGDQTTLRFVRLLRHSREKVWSAITEIRGTHRQALVFDPPHVLECSEEGGLLRFELTPEESHTELVFTHTFSDVAESAGHASQWELWLANLEERLDYRPTTPFSVERFNELFTKYAWEFGPRASSKRTRGLGSLR